MTDLGVVPFQYRGFRAYRWHIEATDIPGDGDSVTLLTPGEGGICLVIGMLPNTAIDFDSGDTMYVGQGVGGAIPDANDFWIGFYAPTNLVPANAVLYDTIATANNNVAQTIGGDLANAGLIDIIPGVPIQVAMENSGAPATSGSFDLYAIIISPS